MHLGALQNPEQQSTSSIQNSNPPEHAALRQVQVDPEHPQTPETHSRGKLWLHVAPTARVPLTHWLP
jgi:hypothetical protein